MYYDMKNEAKSYNYLTFWFNKVVIIFKVFKTKKWL